MKTKSKTTYYLVQSVAVAVLVLAAQISLAGSATWLASPQDSAWENPNNWTPGGPPNGPSEVATFAAFLAEKRNHLDFSGGERHRIHVWCRIFRYKRFVGRIAGGQLIFSGTGVINNSGVYQSFGLMTWAG